MAYFRPSMHVSSSLDQFNISTIEDGSSDRKSKEENPRPLVLFSVDMTHWPNVLQYTTLAGGLILFMCLYGYYQELVVYGWFDRKLSMFSTFLHFLGCSVFAQVQRNFSYRTSHSAPRNCVLFSLGSAPHRVAIFYYILLIVVRTMAQGFSNLCMTQINYPAKVLFKSANPIVTIIIGLVWFKKSYPLRDYVVVFLLVLGLYVFITGDHSASPESTRLGIIYVVLSMLGSAGVPMIQEHCMTTYNASIEDLLYHCYLGSTIMSFVMSFLMGEFVTGIMFLIQSGSLHTWLLMIAFCTFGYAGTNFSAGLTLQYGSLVNGITNTFRKGVTLALSFILFPERNTLTEQKMIGSAIFFSGLVLRIVSRADHSSSSTTATTSNKMISDKISPSSSPYPYSSLLPVSSSSLTGVTNNNSSNNTSSSNIIIQQFLSTIVALSSSFAGKGKKKSMGIDNYIDTSNNSSNSNNNHSPNRHHNLHYNNIAGNNNSNNNNNYNNNHHNHHHHTAATHGNNFTFQSIALADSSDNLLDIESSNGYLATTGVILTGPNAGTDFIESSSSSGSNSPVEI